MTATIKRVESMTFVMPALRVPWKGVLTTEVQAERALENRVARFQGGLIKALRRDHAAISKTRKALRGVELGDVPVYEGTVNGFRSLI